MCNATRYHLVSVDFSTTRPGFRASHRTHGFVASRCAGAALQLRHLVFDEDTALVARRWRIPTRRPATTSDGRTQAPSYFVVGGIHFAGRRRRRRCDLAAFMAKLDGPSLPKERWSRQATSQAARRKWMLPLRNRTALSSVRR